MYFSVSRAPVTATRKYDIRAGENTVANDHHPAIVISHNPHQTQASPK